MWILHTSDWHVGRTIRGRSRADEHRAVLDQVVAIARQEEPDLVLVAGDQFDTAAPAPDAERIVYRTLLDLAGTGARVVVLAGNHDNAGRLDAVAPLLRGMGIDAAAAVTPPAEGGVLDVVVRSGETARIALLPFLSQRAIVRADELMAHTAADQENLYESRLQRIIDTLTADFGTDTVNLVAGHLTVLGGAPGGGERAVHTVLEYAVAATVFPSTAHYVALGHLHKPQRIPAACPVWYCGSPLQLDFGEEGHTKAVLLVDAAAGRPAQVRQVPLTAGRALRTLRGTQAQLEAMSSEETDDHLRIIVTDPAAAGLADRVRGWFPTAVDVRVEAPAGLAATGGSTRLGRSPAALFAEYLDVRGARDDAVLALFAELLEHAAGEQ